MVPCKVGTGWHHGMITLLLLLLFCNFFFSWGHQRGGGTQRPVSKTKGMHNRHLVEESAVFPHTHTHFILLYLVDFRTFVSVWLDSSIVAGLRKQMLKSISQVLCDKVQEGIGLSCPCLHACTTT